MYYVVKYLLHFLYLNRQCLDIHAGLIFFLKCQQERNLRLIPKPSLDLAFVCLGFDLGQRRCFLLIHSLFLSPNKSSRFSFLSVKASLLFPDHFSVRLSTTRWQQPINTSVNRLNRKLSVFTKFILKLTI